MAKVTRKMPKFQVPTLIYQIVRHYCKQFAITKNSVQNVRFSQMGLTNEGGGGTPRARACQVDTPYYSGLVLIAITANATAIKNKISISMHCL